eukprot:tig00000142_g8654.t1
MADAKKTQSLMWSMSNGPKEKLYVALGTALVLGISALPLLRSKPATPSKAPNAEDKMVMREGRLSVYNSDDKKPASAVAK